MLSKVEGDGRVLYKQEIEIIKNINRSSVVIDGRCTCPVGYNCKHIAATCIYYINKMQNKTHNKELSFYVDKWIENLKNTNETQDDTKKPNDDYFITYRLFASSHPYYNDELQFFKSKFLKNGSIGKGTRLNYDKLRNNYDFKKLKNDEAKDIISLSMGLFMNNSSYYDGDMKFTGTLGYMVVQELLKTNKCYFDENKTPLSSKQKSKGP